MTNANWRWEVFQLDTDCVKGATAAHKTDRHGRVWAAVREIPSGRVATYGQIAALCGHPRNARLVGYALNSLPRDTEVPWHRVINRHGQLSLPSGSESYTEQRQRLLTEGILFHADTIDLNLFGWNSGLDELLWSEPTDNQ